MYCDEQVGERSLSLLSCSPPVYERTGLQAQGLRKSLFMFYTIKTSLHINCLLVIKAAMTLTIKKEDSPDIPISSVQCMEASIIPASNPQGNHGALMRSKQKENLIMLPPPPRSCDAAKQPHLAHSAYNGSSPHKYRLAAVSGTSISKNKLILPIPWRLPSLRGSAVATDEVNKRTASTKLGHFANRHNNNNTNRRIKKKVKSALKTEDRAKMDPHDFTFDVDHDRDGGIGLMSPMFAEEQDDTMVTIPRTVLRALQYELQQLRVNQTASQQQMAEQYSLITQLSAHSQHVNGKCNDLNNRLIALEDKGGLRMHPYQNHLQLARLDCKSADRSRSPSPRNEDYRVREPPCSSRKGRKKLEIQLPGQTHMGSAVGLPTPGTSFASNFADQEPRTPKKPLTPGRAGPPSGARRVSNCVNKRLRGVHQLDKTIPPTYALLPMLPLTDTELIVFFFNSLNRPIVSLRLYGRGWGPAAICEVLNGHRVVEPEYLRNTCSVKCTTAIKKGEEQYGGDWKKENTALFEDVENTTDIEATDMIQLAPDELPRRIDFELAKLCVGLRHFPDAESGGIFTKCVKYCHENKVSCKVSEALNLADDLTNGRTPLLRGVPDEDEDELTSLGDAEDSS